MPGVAELQSLWQRSLIVWPDGRRHATTAVRWMQGQSFHVDLRQPSPIADFCCATGLNDLAHDDGRWLARQPESSGRFTRDDRYLEWQRSIDYRPKGRYADALWATGFLYLRPL